MATSEGAREPWRNALFDSLLRGIRIQSTVFFRPEFRAPWGVNIARDCGVFHIVHQGSCWLQVKGVDEPVELSEGDFTVITHGTPHVMRDQLSSPTENFFELVKRNGNGSFSFGGEGAVTRLVCGGMTFENRASNPLLAILPPVLHVRRTEPDAKRWLGHTTEHVVSELDSPGAGAAEVVTRLADILFIRAVRTYFDRNIETASSGWLAAVRDVQIGRALAMLHSQPQQSWTVPTLARQLAMSRSAFAARFTELVGEPPLRYFTRLRINAAAARLRSGNEKLSVIAAAAGYESVAAFVRSFRRHIGMTPGDYRHFRDRCPPPSVGV
ncbi:MAG TPA: AraC family transcriptional regulator [Vicinamibacterales bacterium]|nr:AraC family transcriptional regulator [Vicinamibacterales bacterium]